MKDINIQGLKELHDIIRKLKRKLKKSKELSMRHCTHKSKDGHVNVCDWPSSPVARCNAEGRNKCPMVYLVESEGEE